MKPYNPTEDRTSSEFTERTTDIDGSFQSRVGFDSELADCAMPSSPPPLKHHVTVGACDTKEIHSLVKQQSKALFSQPRVSDDFRPMSPQRVSEIFLRERCKSLFGEESSSESFFLQDMRALFGINQLEEEDDDEEEVLEELPSPANSKKQLRFGGVEIREYPIIPGDSPASYKGVPLTIGWKPVGTVRIDNVDKYESVREHHRRHGKQLSLPCQHRSDILKNQGFGHAEIQKAIKDANHARRQRKESMATLKHQATYEKLESLQRSARNLLTLGKKKKAQKEFLKKYVPSYGVAQSTTFAPIATQ